MILGKICQQFRKELGYLQRDIAKDTGYSVENISAFERGCNDNSSILLWYFSKGLTYNYIVRCGYVRCSR